MQLTVNGKQMDVGDSLRTHIADKLEDINAKYFNRAIDATVTLAPEGHAYTKTHISIQVGKHIQVMADAVETDPYVSFDAAAEKVGKQLRRYKRKLRDHHERIESAAAAEILSATHYTLSGEADNAAEEDESVPQGDDPVVVAEMPTAIHEMSVSEAVMRLDLAGQPALLFRNAKHKGLNVVYRRPDGNIGWIDPEMDKKSA